jgi:hypothetical protein
MILPEGYLFLTLYSPPHLALATAGMLWGMLRVHEAGTHPSRRAAATLAGTTAWTLSALIGAFYTLIPLAVLGVDWLVTALRRRRPDWSALAYLALAALAPALIAGYTLCVFACDPIYRAWSVQNQIGSPHPLHYLAGYALVGALALLGAGRALRRRQAHLQLPLVWVALTPLLVYLPFSMQRRLINGAQVPLCLLAAQGLIYGLILPFGRSAFVRCLSRHPRYSRAGMRRWAIATVVLLTMPTNLLLILGNCLQTSMRAPPIYHSRAELEALDWLRENTAPGDTVLCAYETGNYVPARAGNRVLLGLGTETAYAARKRVEVQRFFDERESDAWRQELLRRYHIAYVLVGPRERTLGGATPFAADGAPYLEAVQSTGTSGDDHYTLYRVKVGP